MAMIKPNEIAKRLGVTVRTLQEWDRNGKFTAHRSPTNRRYYTEEQYRDYLDELITDIGSGLNYNRKNGTSC